jgi:enolase
MEDSFFEDHIEHYMEQMQQYGNRVLVSGDDLLSGNIHRLEDMAGKRAINSAVIKLNMAGTVTRTKRFVDMCQANGFTTIGSCRTYDSPDDTLADLIVGWGCNAYKSGSPAGGEHTAKYNRYIRIDEELGMDPSFSDFKKIKP